ncbi:peroxiredoxin family protein [Fodinibius sp. AD559]|uniref:peroxiredoxin family protein n=1 Tax=Fodinibius sp. AD559 TaxID=3424179 RepID=UPI004046D522
MKFPSEINFCKYFLLSFLGLFLFVGCGGSEDSKSIKAFNNLYREYKKEFDVSTATSNTKLEKWIGNFWELREQFPNTSGATRGTVQAYKIAVDHKDIIALDTLFHKISIQDDAMADILRFLPYTPIYENAIPKLRQIRRESDNINVQTVALLQSAMVHQTHRRYGQVAVILDSLAAEFSITRSHPEYGDEIEKLEKNMTSFSIGQKLHNFETTTIDGRQFSSKDFKGKVTLVYFYNTGCGTCIKMIPKLNQLYNKYKSSNFEILGVSADGPYLAEKEFRNEI